MRTIKLLSHLRKLKKEERLSAESVDQLTRKRFVTLIEKAFNTSSFYRDLYTAHGITEKDLSDVELKDLPIIDKSMVMENFDDLITDPSITRKSVEQFLSGDHNPMNRFRGNTVIHTSGSSGVPGLFLYSREEWIFLIAMVVSRVSKPKLHPFQRIRFAYLGAIDGHYAGITLTSDAPKLLYNTTLFSSSDDMDIIIDKLNRFNPHVISGYASTVYQLALAKLSGRLTIEPERVLSSGEHLTESMRLTIDMAFEPDVVNFYACTESLAMGVQFHASAPFRLFSDWTIFETVNSQGEAVPQGCEGGLVITPLYRFLQPLIRYRLSDALILGKKDKQFTIADSLSGRMEESLDFIDEEGKNYKIPSLALSEFFIPGVIQFQFEQTSPQALTLRILQIKGDRGVKKQGMNRMNELLKEFKLERFVTVNIELVDKIPLNPITHKFQLIIPYKS